MRAALAGLVLFLLASPAQAASYMIGTWFGHGQPGDQASMYIDRMHADGTWRGEYRYCRKGKSVDQVQLGRWALAGDILTLGIETVDGMFAPRSDTYKMLAHTAQSQKYISLQQKFSYTPQRVADNFQMPSCELTS